MEDSSAEFPGFQNCVHNHKDDFVFRRSLSRRLQRHAPSPLQLKPTVPSACNGAAQKSFVGSSNSSSPPSSSSSLNPFYHSKDPIPLLSPLVLPSLLDSAYIQQGNTRKSRWIFPRSIFYNLRSSKMWPLMVKYIYSIFAAMSLWIIWLMFFLKVSLSTMSTSLPLAFVT